jgi:hypothetical protein
MGQNDGFGFGKKVALTDEAVKIGVSAVIFQSITGGRLYVFAY